MRFSLLLFIFLSTSVTAQWRPFETTDDARSRHEAQRYEQYKRNNYREPLGGYSEKLGDPAPYGTRNPGSSYGSGDRYSQPNNNSGKYSNYNW